MNNQKKLILIIGGFIALSLFAVIIAVIAQPNSEPLPGERSIERYDANSNTSYIESDRSDNLPPGSTSNSPLLLGFAELLQRGFSVDQVEIIKNTLSVQAKEAGIDAEIISLSSDSIKREITQSDNGNTSVVTFTVQINQQKRYTVKITDISFTTLRISMSDGQEELFNVYFK